MTATYDGLEFKTPLEARWAAFFDLAGWQWHTNSVAVGDWRPDFKVTFPCGHSECGGDHVLLASVLPISSLTECQTHPCRSHIYAVKGDNDKWLADGGAIFGNDPTVTEWQISHGSGGGIENVNFRLGGDEHRFWQKAATLVNK